MHGGDETSSSRLTGQIQCQAMPEKPARAWEPSSFERCSASADMVVDGENSKIRGTRTDSMWSNMIFGTRRQGGAYKDITGGQRDQCEAAWTKTKTHARCRTGNRKRVSACTFLTDRYKEICMGKFDTHRLRIWIKPRTKTVKQVAWNTWKA